MSSLIEKNNPAEFDLAETSSWKLVPTLNKLLCSGALFLLGLLILDQGVLRLGDSLMLSPYWDNQLLPNLAKARSAEVVFYGDCRVSTYLDSSLVGPILGKEVFNAGKILEKIGNIEFALDVAVSNQIGKVAVFVIPDDVLDQNAEATEQEIRERWLWTALLNVDTRAELAKLYPKLNNRFESGLWKYKGKGEELTRGLLRKLFKKANAGSDGYYVPAYAEFNMAESLKENPDAFQKNRKAKLNLNPFAMNKLEQLISVAKKAGMRPILVLPPMHELNATPEVRDNYTKVMNELSVRNEISLLNYLILDTELSAHPDWWVDTGHLNSRGAKMFAQILAKDLKKIIP